MLSREQLKTLLPGWFMLLLIAVIASKCSSLITLAGKHPVEASALALVIGLGMRATLNIPSILLTGAQSYEKLLIAGIVLLGAAFNLEQFGSHLFEIAVILVVSMLLAFSLVRYLAEKFGVAERLAVLLAIGTTICGTTAVALTAPLIKAKPSETGYAVGIIALCGLIAMLTYPLIGTLLDMNQLHFGVFAGIGIHSTAQVVGAGYIFGDEAGGVATAVKLLRNCAMAPAALIIAAWWNNKPAEDETHTKLTLRKSFPWFMFGYFIMAYLGAQGVFSATGEAGILWTGKLLIVMALAGIGISTDLASIKSLGLKPFLAAAIGAIGLSIAVWFLCGVMLFKEY